MKNGFTLIEVLAVIVMLGLIFAISIPKIQTSLKDSTKKAFSADAIMVLKTIDLKIGQGFDYEITSTTIDDLKSVFSMNNANYKAINISYEDDIPYIALEGQNKWQGLVAYGTIYHMNVKESDFYDAIPPSISLIGSSTVYVEQNTPYVEVGATATDNHDGDITNKIKISGSVNNTSSPGTYVLSYAVTDNAGNTSSVDRTVIVVAQSAPTVAFSMDGSTNYTNQYQITVTVTDNVAVDTASLKYQWTTTTTTPTEASFTTTFTNGGTISSPAGVNGGYYLWVIAKDYTGNTTIVRTNVFNIDSVAPVITLNGSSTVNVTVSITGASYTDAGATATDNREGNITSRIVTYNPVNVDALKVYTVTYFVSDSAGNYATAVRTVNVNQLQVEYVVVAGGGGGQTGAAGGGGGGAGGYRSSVTGEMSGGGASAETKPVLSLGSTYTVIVGAGGAGSGKGGDSTFNTITATGGGAAGGGTGGSGAGGYEGQVGGAGTASQGYAGGTGSSGSGFASCGGGGGAGGIGANGVLWSTGGAGGIGVPSSITGTSIYRAGGGAGANEYISSGAGAGGNGGGAGSNTAGVAAANTGGGGSGGYGSAGGSGVVIIRYYGGLKATGGTISSANGYTIHTFTTVGTSSFQVIPPSNNNTLEIEYLIVGGGGGGQTGPAGGGGGGAGGYRSSVTGEMSGGGANAESKILLTSGTTYSVVVGLGGTAGGGSGGNSSFDTITSIGGGGAGGKSGGSGAGGYEDQGGGSGTPGQGYKGGSGSTGSGFASCGGGGGAAGAGANGVLWSTGGAGGNGVASSITGTSIYRAGGGAGANEYISGGAGAGGLGGGGGSNNVGVVTPSSGSGGSGGYGSAGAAGIVIIRYPGTQRATGGTVTTSGGYTIHTFTASGSFIVATL